MLRNIENRGAKRMFLDTFGLEVFDEEEEGDYALLMGQQLSNEMVYVVVEEIVESIGCLEDREAFAENNEELTLYLFQGLFFDV